MTGYTLLLTSAFAIAGMTVAGEGPTSFVQGSHFKTAGNASSVWTEAPPPVTNHLSFFITTIGASFGDTGQNFTNPILADRDFVAWSNSDHSFTIKPAAALRLYDACQQGHVGFMLKADEQPIYWGFFNNRMSSSATSDAQIETGSIRWAVRSSAIGQLYAEEEKRPSHSSNTLHGSNSDSLLMGQINALLASTHCATNNVTLKIERGRFPAAQDERDDQRLLAAVKKLFPAQ
jgi:hypothetical protein